MSLWVVGGYSNSLWNIFCCYVIFREDDVIALADTLYARLTVS